MFVEGVVSASPLTCEEIHFETVKCYDLGWQHVCAKHIKVKLDHTT